MAGGKNQENEVVGAIGAISCSEPTISPTTNPTEEQAQDQSHGSMRKASVMFMSVMSFVML